MAHLLVVKKIAHEMLDCEGVKAIWNLHLDAAALYRIGNSVSADVFLDIADAATEEWQRRYASDGFRVG
jgi:hypothetical protein